MSFSDLFPGVAIIVGTILTIVVIWALVQAVRIRKPRLSTGGLTLFIDDEAGVLVASHRDQTGIERMPLNTMTWGVSGKNLRITTFEVEKGFAVGKFYEYDQATVVRSVDFWVGDGNPKLAKRWLDRWSLRLAPDVAGHIKALNAQKKDLAAAARRHLPETPVVECDTGRVIDHYAYVAFLPSGFVYGMKGADSIPLPVMRVHAGDVTRGKGRTVHVIFPRAGDAATFVLTGQEMQAIQTLQEKGVLTLAPPLPTTY